MRVAFVGLGVMGYPMAGYLSKSDHDVVVYNRSVAKAEAWCAEFAGTSVESPAAAANAADIVFICVGNDDDVREVVLGDLGVLSAMQAGAVVVDHTTASASIAREIHAAAAARNIGFLDAPLSGGQAGRGKWTADDHVGGDEATFAVAEPVMDCYAKAITRIGPAGSGQLAKMVNQICIAGVVQGLAEGLSFAKHAELDPELLIEAISKGAAQSWQMENRWQTMVNGEFDFGFAVDWMRKDLKIAMQEADRNGSKLQMTELVDKFYTEIQEMGGSRWDTSSLIARLL